MDGNFFSPSLSSNRSESTGALMAGNGLTFGDDDHPPSPRSLPVSRYLHVSRYLPPTRALPLPSRGPACKQQGRGRCRQHSSDLGKMLQGMVMSGPILSRLNYQGFPFWHLTWSCLGWSCRLTELFAYQEKWPQGSLIQFTGIMDPR